MSRYSGFIPKHLGIDEGYAGGVGMILRRRGEMGGLWLGGRGRFAGRKVRAVGVGWASSGFFDFAQNDGFVRG